MSWLDDLQKKLPEAQMHILNDAKSPSGVPHVGSLRGILAHDAPYRFLKEKGVPVKYIYGSDDYDPLDEIPGGQSAEVYEKYLGVPLCNVPAPPGSAHKDIAMHYISDFFKIFEEIGVDAEKYYMRDIYRNGTFNEAIDIVLKNVEKIRKIYYDVSHSERSPHWYPFQAVCDKCGRIGTTEVIDYDGKEVTYICKEDLVKWAKGCGHTGKKSPFDGNGKMPFKVEWASKWKYLGVTIEGAGSDHNTKGGSRDVASAICSQVFGQRPPTNIPYSFFILGGAKMSSSKGIGASARAMTNFLPPEILRFLMLNSKPKSEVNFEPTEKYIVKLFNDFDKLHDKVLNNQELEEYEKLVYELSQVHYKEKYFTVEFSLILTLVQLPHIDIYKEVAKRKGSELTEIEKENINQRIKAAKFWLENFATEEEKMYLQAKMPKDAEEKLDNVQRAFLHKVATYIENINWTEEDLQKAVFAAVRTTPIQQANAFTAFYKVLLNKDKGPKAGNLLAYLDKQFIIERFTELKYDNLKYYIESATELAEIEEWLNKEADKISTISTHKEIIENNYFLDINVTLKDEKSFIKRLHINDVDTEKTFEEIRKKIFTK